MSDLTAECCRELIELGPQAYRRALGEAVHVSAVEETATNTLDNNLLLDTHTDYKMSGGKHDVVIEQLLSRVKPLIEAKRELRIEASRESSRESNRDSSREASRERERRAERRMNREASRALSREARRVEQRGE